MPDPVVQAPTEDRGMMDVPETPGNAEMVLHLGRVPRSRAGPSGARACREAMVLQLKPSLKSRKGRELDAKRFDAGEAEKFLAADTKQWEKHLELGAVKIIWQEEAEEILRNK